ncbi:MAG: SMC-Scp complex subunit ScpB [Thermoanaerobaculia bacterium]|nr:MAG: SMC-Scp complex subunit ScpB [Thermoanaerobaculia bacterium]MBZ0103537.1 SMC-Scp complex subunit ScpB [Thermoanaerobaculia bacterium]
MNAEEPIQQPEVAPDGTPDAGTETPESALAAAPSPAPRAEFQAALEAILFVTAEPVSIERLLGVFEEGERAEARVALDAVRSRYAADEGRGVRLEEVAGGLRIVTAPECHPWLRRFFDAAGANRLSMAALETLAIIAYRQPVTGPEVQELRSRNSSTAIRTLLERRLIRITGRREVVGRPFVYATTREFLMHFGLRSLSDLPPLEEFEETFGGGEGDVAIAMPAAVSHGHEALGMVSAGEAESELGSASFTVHGHPDHAPGGSEEPPEAAIDPEAGEEET